MKPRIMMVASEAQPWAKTGGLGEVVDGLSAALGELGHEVTVVIPRYAGARTAPSSRIWDSLRVRTGTTTRQVSVWQLDQSAVKAPNVTFYFVDEPWLFDREGLYGNARGDFPDNHIRFAVLARAAMEIARKIRRVDVFHCHDWQAALVPAFLKYDGVADPCFFGAKTLLTIHNLGYQGIFEAEQLPETGVPQGLFHPEGLEFHGKMNFLKAGIVYADRVNTVSRKYAEEIQTAHYGWGLDGVIRARAWDLSGIVNGIDYARWDPGTDPMIAAKYSAGDVAGKAQCKRELVERMGLGKAAMGRPVVGIVSRFAGQKGFDLLREAEEEIVESDVYVAALGSGEPQIEEYFKSLAQKYPGRVGVQIGYDEKLAHQIEAGSDLFLMPSRYEPCGLNQIYSLRYGTLPLVRATGGLDDTVVDGGEQATGFKFTEYNGRALAETLRRAAEMFGDRAAWRAMMLRGMEQDWGWLGSAMSPAAGSAYEYSRLYERLTGFESPKGRTES